jgi:hypothetical protein
MSITNRNVFAEPGGLINVEAFRASAVRRANSEHTETTIHHHAWVSPCKGHKHEHVKADGTIDERMD